MENIKNCLTLGQWSDIEGGAPQEILEKKILPNYLRERRWFAGKSKTIQSVSIRCRLRVPGSPIPSYLWLLSVGYSDSTKENYVMGTCFVPDREMPEEQMRPPVLCSITLGLENGWLCDATWCDSFRTDLIRHFATQSDIDFNGTHLKFKTSPLFHQVVRELPPSRLLNAEQSNTSIVYGNKLFLKLYRKVEPGVNPDVELSRFLTTEGNFTESPAWVGEIEWHTPEGTIGVGILQEMIPQSVVAWNYFMPMIKSAIGNPSYDRDELTTKIEQLGALTGAMHNALLPTTNNSDFTPEWLDTMELEEMRGRVMMEIAQNFDLLRQNLEKLSPRTKTMAVQLLDSQEDLVHILKDTYQAGANAMLMRLHGDLHLGQVLVSEDRMLVTDFEGEPGRSYEERRRKQPPVKDIAGMIRSFQYAIYSAKLFNEDKEIHEDDLIPLDNLLNHLVEVYLKAYCTTFERSDASCGDFTGFLRFFVIEKAVYELKYEINNRPDWAVIPIAGLQSAIRDWMESGMHYRA
jgi:maltose alpha-D-glucosyltransferase/alpha-amylase